jgi:hypothetical protein
VVRIEPCMAAAHIWAEEDMLAALVEVEEGPEQEGRLRAAAADRCLPGCTH